MVTEKTVFNSHTYYFLVNISCTPIANSHFRFGCFLLSAMSTKPLKRDFKIP